MKIYMKNKNFIPEKFYDKKELHNNKKDKNIVVLFLVVNLLLVPVTTKSIGKIQQTHILDINHIYSKDKSSEIDINDINIWIETIISDDIEEAHITKSNGEIIVSNLEKIDGLSSNEFIKINEMNLNNEGKYKLGVSFIE